MTHGRGPQRHCATAGWDPAPRQSSKLHVNQTNTPQLRRRERAAVGAQYVEEKVGPRFSREEPEYASFRDFAGFMGG
jgi:hypothetical protein